MKLDLRFTVRPLEALWCHTAVAFLFREPIGSGDAMAGLNTKMAGYLSCLWHQGFWTGQRKETLLVPSQGMIHSNGILLKGLGSRDTFNKQFAVETLRETGSILRKMRVKDMGIRIPALDGLEPDSGFFVETACLELVNSFFPLYRNEPDFILKVVASVNVVHFEKIAFQLDSLKRHFDPTLNYTVVFDNGDARSSCRDR